jgi:2-C-methyl-D-erythritol 4-phosphate cytidylyltransferase
MADRDVAVIVAAGGTGNRYGKAKQFEMLGELPIYQYVVRTFSAIEPVHSVILVGREADLPTLQQGLQELNPPINWKVVAGGESRQDSVERGLRAVREIQDISIVLVHDVARVLVDDTIILSVIGAIREYGSAIAGIKFVDTLKRVIEHEIVETVARESLWRAQTPQGARLPQMLAAFEEARKSGYQGTDEAELLERIGEQPRLVEGSELNFKITYPADLERARYLLRNQTQARI